MPTTALLLFLLSFPGANLAQFHSSLWCSGPHSESRACSFQNICYSPTHDEFLFFRDPEWSTLSGIGDPEETKELLKIPPFSKTLHLSMFKANEAHIYGDLIQSTELLLIHWDTVHSLKTHFFPHLVLPIWRSLQRLCLGDIHNCTLPDIALKYEDKRQINLSNQASNLLQKLYNGINILNFITDSKSVACYKKLHVGHLDEKYSGESFRNYVLQTLGLIEETPRNHVVILVSSSHKSSQLSKDFMQEMCPDCTQEERLLLSDETEYLETLRSLSSARVVVCSNYCLTAGLLMHKESILVPQLSEGLDEEPSPDLLNLLRNRGNIELRPWYSSETNPSPSRYSYLEDEEEDDRLWIFPSRITGFGCNLEIKASELTVNLLWDPPLNSGYFTGLTYELYVQGMVSKEDIEEDLIFLDQFSVKQRSASFPVNAKIYSALKVYILAKVPLDVGFENKGIDADFICDLDKDIKFSE